jgi:hypothetical protein
MPNSNPTPPPQSFVLPDYRPAASSGWQPLNTTAAPRPSAPAFPSGNSVPTSSQAPPLFAPNPVPQSLYPPTYSQPIFSYTPNPSIPIQQPPRPTYTPQPTYQSTPPAERAPLYPPVSSSFANAAYNQPTVPAFSAPQSFQPYGQTTTAATQPAQSWEQVPARPAWGEPAPSWARQLLKEDMSKPACTVLRELGLNHMPLIQYCVDLVGDAGTLQELVDGLNVCSAFVL